MYKKGTFQFPKSPNHSGEFAQLILGVISLRRLVLRSYSNLNLIVQAKYREEIEMLNIDHEDGDALFRSDSTAATNAADDDMVNVYNNNEMEPWLEEELLLEIDNIKQDNEDLKTYGDWEEFLMEKAKKLRASSDE